MHSLARAVVEQHPEPKRCLPSAFQLMQTFTTGTQTKVVVIDDHPAIRDALATVIAHSGDLVFSGEASSGEEAFRVLGKEGANVAIIDIGLPDTHGLDLVENLVAQHPDLKVVVFSVYDEDVYAERAIRAGALGYVMKREPVQVVLEAIRCVSRGDVYLSRTIASRIVTRSALKRSAEPSSPIDQLTDRELAVFQMLGEGYSVEAISKRLHLSRKTVETHRRHAKEKLGLESVSELLLFAVRWTDGQRREGS